MIGVMGGLHPMIFLVDGRRPPNEPVRREAGWRPPRPGFRRITVPDARGAAVRTSIRIRQA